jgi:phospholipase/carboxylesterase
MAERIGQLDCIKREGDDPSKVVVMLHGFGADMGDLAPLADVLDPSGDWTFYFPNAPIEVPIGPAWTGRGWFPISLRELEAGIDFTKIRPPGLDLSRKLVEELVFNINPKKLVIGGFSQGAMVATDFTLQQPDEVAALLIYSGVLLDEEAWTKRAVGLKGKKFLQSHGERDQVIPISGARRLYDILKSAGADGPFVSFGGAHEIPANVIQKTALLLQQI